MGGASTLKARPGLEAISIGSRSANRGVPMRDILDLVKPTAKARYAVLYSFADGGDGGRYYDTHTAWPTCATS